ncbi:hypothetical protein EV401DRAFT_1889489 [Pisolithus croceorrhizus]|nr:hypothetical protein EV401DRAFT_1889489 [Pisolithus croceorrhizus]
MVQDQEGLDNALGEGVIPPTNIESWMGQGLVNEQWCLSGCGDFQWGDGGVVNKQYHRKILLPVIRGVVALLGVIITTEEQVTMTIVGWVRVLGRSSWVDFLEGCDFGEMSYRRDDDIRGTVGDDVEMNEGSGNDTDATFAGIQTWVHTLCQKINHKGELIITQEEMPVGIFYFKSW